MSVLNQGTESIGPASPEGEAKEINSPSDGSPQNGRTEVSPLQQEEYEQFQSTKPPVKGCVKYGEGLTVIIISSITFSIGVTVALIITIIYGPPQVPLHGVVTCDVPVCSAVGTDILKKGGSAVDAAVATTLCVGVVNAHSSGIGGGGFMLVHTHKNMKTSAIDFRETAPAAATKTMFVADQSKASQGGLSVAVPSELQGLKQAHDQFGHLSWKDVVMPAANLASKGFNITKDLADTLAQLHGNGKTLNSALAAIYMPGGVPLKEGAFIQRPDYANTLKLIAEGGIDSFYSGSTADNIVSAANGVLSKSDLQNYKAKTVKTVQIEYQNFTVLSLPPPSGGSTVLSVLNILDGYNFTHKDASKNLTIHRMIEAIKFGYGGFYQLGDPQFVEDVNNATDSMLSEDMAKQILSKIADDKTFPAAHYGTVRGTQITGTQHISVISNDEQIVSLTTSIGGDFGSQIMTSDGIILNNHMSEFTIPGASAGSSENTANYAEGGKRPLSPMAPVIMHSSSRPCGLRLAVGGEKGNGIIAGVVEVILKLTNFGMSLKDSIETPRFQNILYPNTVIYEDGFPERTVAFLRQLGHQVKMTDKLGPVNAAMKINETISAHADSRGYGQASKY